jgi:hypothetical protein
MMLVRPDARMLLIQALRRAKQMKQVKRPKPLDAADRAPGTGTNEGGPQVQTDYPANAWPEDGDHG